MKRVFYDISTALGRESIDYPGDPPFGIRRVSTLEGGGPCELSELSLSAHGGTHVDAPSHFIAGGKTIDEYGPESFILPAVVIGIRDREKVRMEECRGAGVSKGCAILFKTRNSETGLCRSGIFSGDFVHITPEAAGWCAQREVSLVGLDYITIDPCEGSRFPAHRILLERGILVLEGINLEGVPPGEYTLICLPLKIPGAEAAPARAVLTKITPQTSSDIGHTPPFPDPPWG